jgi:1-acyl-sn-glycerol-3-phosphate acyltransferase
MLSLVLFACLGILYFAIFSPYIYSCITWNYSLALFSALSFYTNGVVFVVLLAIYMLLPTETVDYLFKNLIGLFRNAFGALIDQTERNIRDTFKIHILYPIPKRSINIWHPHGMSGITPVIHNGYRITDPTYSPTKGVVHSFFFRLPIVKDIIRNLNAIPSDYSSIKRTLQTDSVSIALGGVKEMEIFEDNTIEVSVKSRKGIFKIALETGTPIVPAITYGENEIFPRPRNSFLDFVNDVIYKVFTVRMPFPSITSLQNWQKISKHPLEQVHSYTGRPIRVKKIEFPTEKHIATLRRIYIKRVKELFNKTNHGNFKLNII